MPENKLATKDDLKEMYNRILPYLGGGGGSSSGGTGFYVVISYPALLVGESYTITGGNEEYSGTFDDSLSLKLTVLEPETTYTIETEYDGQAITGTFTTVEYYTKITSVLTVALTSIIVPYEVSSASTLTLKDDDGNTVKSVNIEAGDSSYTFTNLVAQAYTIELSDGTYTSSQSVPESSDIVITASKMYGYMSGLSYDTCYSTLENMGLTEGYTIFHTQPSSWDRYRSNAVSYRAAKNLAWNSNMTKATSGFTGNIMTVTSAASPMNITRNGYLARIRCGDYNSFSTAISNGGNNWEIIPVKSGDTIALPGGNTATWITEFY